VQAFHLYECGEKVVPAKMRAKFKAVIASDRHFEEDWFF
jgi:hypothetical protein